MKKLFRSTGLVSGMTLVSRLMGFVRDVILSLTFGAGPAFDAFVIAFKLPNFVRQLFADGAFSQAFVPIMSEYRATQPAEKIQEFLDRMTGLLFLILFFVVIIAQLFAPLIVMVFAPGFLRDPGQFHLTTSLLRIIFPYLLFISLTALTGAVLNSHGRFGAPSFGPVLFNVALIAAALFISPHFSVPIYGLACGVLLGGLLQLIMMLIFLRKLKLIPRLKIDWQDEGVKRVLKLMLPAFFGVSVSQISIVIDNFFASFLPHGSISWLYYSDRLTYLPLGVIGVALATVVMPFLSRAHATKSTQEYSQTLDWALRMALLIGLPSSLGLAILAGPILATLFFHGTQFRAFDVIMTAKSLIAFSLGLPAFMLIKILASAFYSRQNIKTPVKIGLIAMGINLILNFILIFPLKHAGLALATTLSSTVNASLLFVLLFRSKVFQPNVGWPSLLSRLILANAVMAILLLYFAGELKLWLEWSSMTRIIHLLALMALGGLAYFLTLFLAGFRTKDLRPPALG